MVGPVAAVTIELRAPTRVASLCKRNEGADVAAFDLRLPGADGRVRRLDAVLPSCRSTIGGARLCAFGSAAGRLAEHRRQHHRAGPVAVRVRTRDAMGAQTIQRPPSPDGRPLRPALDTATIRRAPGARAAPAHPSPSAPVRPVTALLVDTPRSSDHDMTGTGKCPS